MLKVVPIYESNMRAIVPTLDMLKTDCVKDDVKSLVTVCMRNGELDVRAMGEAELADVFTLLSVAQRFILGHMKIKLEKESC